jgi:Protein of unknown function (DUF3082)
MAHRNLFLGAIVSIMKFLNTSSDGLCGAGLTIVAFVAVVLIGSTCTNAFLVVPTTTTPMTPPQTLLSIIQIPLQVHSTNHRRRRKWYDRTSFYGSESDETDRTNAPVTQINRVDIDEDDNDTRMPPSTTTAAMGTINERLLAELQQATALEKAGGARSTIDTTKGKNRYANVASMFQSTKTDAERRAAIAEAQNLNGVDPISTLLGAIFALTCATGLWYLTQSLAAYFASHPAASDVYFVERVTLVSQTIIMGLVALASGFFGVTGIGILLLAIRVGYGVITGELDPTPIASNNPSNTIDTNTKVDMNNVWDMMRNKSTKKGQR